MKPPLLRLDKLFAHSPNVDTFDEGETIFAEGSAAECMWVVLEGTVDIYVGDKLLDISGPGDLLGEMAIIDSRPRSATAVARTPARLARLNEGAFLEMVGDTPFFALHVMRVLVTRMRRDKSRA